MRFKLFTVSVVLFGLVAALSPAAAQEKTKPFGLPLADPPGPSTWLFGQPYGNTVGAYNFGTAWYQAGQGLHFGVDLSMPCGTPLVAVADGEVIYVDNLAFGAGPHNLILRHPQAGLTTLYGHMKQRAVVTQYQPVKRGQLVGYSGDPDLTCDSRPHLHLEVRSLDYRTAYNPLDYIDAPWDTIAVVGSFNLPLFQQDLTHPRQWMSLDNQPPIAFGGRRLNNYPQTWPPANENRPPASAPIPQPVTPLADNVLWTMKQLATDGCCAAPWWHPTDSNRLFSIDGAPGSAASILEWDMNGKATAVGTAPPPWLSPDGTYAIERANQQISIRHVAEGKSWVVNTNGELPAISADNSRLLWLVQNGRFVPGTTPPQVKIWISDMDGQNAKQVLAKARASASWLDGSRLLISVTERTLTSLAVYDAKDGSSYDLGTWDRLRGLSIAPGGGRLLFYQTFQADTAQNAIYTLKTERGAQPEKLTWFGGWRWRDANSLYYIPFDPTSAVQVMAYYDIATGTSRLLTDPVKQPLTIADGDWSVSPDGRRIAFLNAIDHRTWLLEMQGS